MSKVVFLDVDGTIINYKAQTPKSAKDAIVQARNNGHKILINTGCSKYEILQRDLPEFDGMILANGAYVEVDNTILLHNSLSKEEEKNIVDFCQDRKLGFYLECNSGMYINEYMIEQAPSAFTRYMVGKGKNVEEAKQMLPNILQDFIPLKKLELYRSDVNKISYVLSKYSDYLECKELFPNLVHNTWGGKGALSIFGDVSPSGINKKNAIGVVLGHWHVDKQDTIAFGDANIDLSMFELCGYGVAMGNASSDLKEKADYITDDVDQDGLYKAFEYLKLI